MRLVDIHVTLKLLIDYEIRAMNMFTRLFTICLDYIKATELP